VSLQLLGEAIRAQLTPEAAAWLGESFRAVLADPAELGRRWSAAGRKLGKGRVDVAPEVGEEWPFVPRGWGADEAGRALLLLGAIGKTPPGDHRKLVETLFRTGEMREQQAVLKLLGYLPEPDRYVPLATEAVRTNVLSVIEAIACDNPFPGRHLSEEAFNQMVLKCLFNGIPLGRIEGLAGRRTPELVRMVEGYASERRAAGRPVPADAALILDGGPHAPV
jgi:hypothetical protein